jgi:hypothetical protein
MSKYLQIFNTLDTYKSIADICAETGLPKGSIQHYCQRLYYFGHITRQQSHVPGHPFMFKRVFDTITASQLARIHNRRTLMVDKKEEASIEEASFYNQILFGIKSIPVAIGRKIMPEENAHLRKLHIDSSKLRNSERKSPKNYIGTSFGLVGW